MAGKEGTRLDEKVDVSYTRAVANSWRTLKMKASNGGHVWNAVPVSSGEHVTNSRKN